MGIHTRKLQNLRNTSTSQVLGWWFIIMEEKELIKRLTEIANKEAYVLIPRSYYERLFNSVQQLQKDLKTAREKRDKLKGELKIWMKK